VVRAYQLSPISVAFPLGRPFFIFSCLLGEGMLYSLTVFFEDPWWVWLFTILDKGASQYCRVVFRKEPANTEVYQYFLNNYYQLKFTDGISAMPENPVNGNPKRRKREIANNLKVKLASKRPTK
jgi:hypothetical protein